MRRQYIKHLILTLGLSALAGLATYFALGHEVAPLEGHDPLMFLSFLNLLAGALCAGFLMLLGGLFWFATARTVSQAWRVSLLLGYVPLLLVIGLGTLLALAMLSPNWFFIPVVLIDLWLLGFMLMRFPRSHSRRLSAPVCD